MELVDVKDEELLKIQLKEVNRQLKESEKIPENNNLQSFLRFKELDERIIDFIEIFINTFTEEQTDHMLSQLETLSMVDRNFNSSRAGEEISLGEYYGIENRIYLNCYGNMRIDRKKDDETFYNELLRMASTKKTALGTTTGLEGPDAMGLSLNDGYTKYLVKKYFTETNDYVYSENKDLLYAIGIENIIGKEKMQEYFLNGDLESLIEQLSKYSSEDDIYKILFLMNKQHFEKENPEETAEIISVISEMNEKRLIERHALGEISDDEFHFEYAKKVSEYRKQIIWGEEATIVRENDIFVIYEDGDCSIIYEIPKPDPSKQKKYK